MKRNNLTMRYGWLFVLALGAALAPAAARAELSGEQTVDGGGVVSYTNAAAVSWIDNADGSRELLLKFLPSDLPSCFVLPGTTSARILAIGGGGGGGGMYRAGGAVPYGGGGGGGAGGMLETNALFSAGTYAVTVGAGGAAAVNGNSASGSCLGESGSATTILMGGADWIEALGGGGGGGQSAGGDGASGGGGSYLPTGKTTGEARDGGQTLDSTQGHEGGTATAAVFGAGGGGAGKAGESASTVAGSGGDGRQSDITLPVGTDPLSWPWYAGGGGGADSTKTITGSTYGIAGGKGGGGQGGRGLRPGTGGGATSGVDGTGGGGGGSGNAAIGTFAGKGGDGIVYVRISAAMIGELEKPSAEPQEYDYDGNAHTSIVNSVFYNVTGQNIATNAGTYVATVKLDGNNKWPDGSDDQVTVTMVIKPITVTLSNLGFDRTPWIYGDGIWETSTTVPKPVCTIDSQVVKPIFEYATEEDDWSEEVPLLAGKYRLRVRLPESPNYVGVGLTNDFEILKRPVKFTDLKVRDWMLGTPESATPKPTCTVTPDWATPIYSYGTQNVDRTEWIWSYDKPTTLGKHKLRVDVPDANNYEITADSDREYEFEIVKGLGHLFTDYVDITVNYDGPEPKVLTNFPYKVTLSETQPPGFLYSRAGGNGNQLTFTDAKGNTNFAYQVGNWNTNGTSVLYVCIDRIEAGVPQKIRLYWSLRDGAVAPDHYPENVWADWKDEDYKKVPYTPPSFNDAVSREDPKTHESRLVNYWKVEPRMSLTFWDIADKTVGKITQQAVPAFGNARCTYTNIVDGIGYDELPTKIGGSFRVVWELVDPDEIYEPLECHIDYAVSMHNPWDDLKGDAKNLTLSGRVMLANDDVVDEAHAVSDQSYWQIREVDDGNGNVITNDIFWVHEGDFYQYDVNPYLLPNSQHRLQYIGDAGQTNTLWRFENVRMGNPWYTGFEDRLYLPWSATSLGISSYEKRTVKGAREEAGCIVMRNMGDENSVANSAVVYSPCYTNGIGTIYFDAVNGQKDQIAAGAYRIVVEVATATYLGETPTDEHARGENEDGEWDELGKIRAEQWRQVDMIPLLHTGTAAGFVAQPPTNDFNLAVTKSNSTNEFYRICVPVNYRGAVRFRIRRMSSIPRSVVPFDFNEFILLDNIIVSYPSMSATLKPEPYGNYDERLSGKRIVGWGGAMDTPFPAAGQTDVRARAYAELYVNAFTNVNPASLVLRSQMYYRWRYLDQAYQPENPNEWKHVDLWPADNWVSREALELPKDEGDLEFWYKTDLNVPYYDYFDYTGLGLKLKGTNGQAAYTEEKREVTAVLNQNDYGPLPSCGTNWFVRLRAGRSNNEYVRLLVKTGEDTVMTNDMELVADQTWRGCVQTPEKVEGGLAYRFEYVNPQQLHGKSYENRVECYAAEADLFDLPGDVSFKPSTPDKWTKVLCDAQTGYLMFKIDEAKQSVYVARCDYQDFNHWSTALKTNEVFVGSSVDTNTTTYVAQEIDMDYAALEISSATNAHWTENFDVSTSEVARLIYPRDEPFSNGRSRNGWTIKNGMWTYGKWSIESKEGYGDDTALQLEGCGRGEMSYIDAADIPHGVDCVTYSARLAQFNEFEDFTYFNGLFVTNSAGTIKTLDDIVPATGLRTATLATLAAFTESGEESYHGDGSLSLVANYDPENGGYEFRVSRATSKDSVRLALYRWRMVGRVMKCELLDVVKDYNASSTLQASRLVKNWDGKANGELGGLYISVGRSSDNRGVVIQAGVYRDNTTLYSNTSKGSSMTGKSFQSIVYLDTSPEQITHGTFGMLSRNCPGVFVKPQYYSKNVNFISQTANKIKDSTGSVTFVGTASDDSASDGYYARWIRKQRRMDRLSGHQSCWGFQGVTDMAQDVLVQISPHGAGNWVTVATNHVSSFSDATYTNVIRTAQISDVRLLMGGDASDPRADVVVRDVELTQWQGEATPAWDDSSNAGLPNEYVYTSSWVLPPEGLSSNRIVRLQPARATNTAQSVALRTPIMRGFGLFHFDWRNADPNCVLLVQIATNATANNLINVTRQPSDADRFWETLETLDLGKLGASGYHTTYVNRRYPSSGVLRVVVDRNVVAKAIETGMPRDNPLYGSVELTAAFAWDLPEYDSHSWTGWNFRTDGWNGTDPGPWANLYDGKHGISGLLNNTLDQKTLADTWSDYAARLPSVQSPTFGTNCIGAVDFRARLYNADDLKTYGHPAVVTLYGAKRKDIFGEPSDWTEVCDVLVSNGYYRTFSKRFKPSESFFALRLAVKGVPQVTQGGTPTFDPPLRVALDDVCIYERPPLTVTFRQLHVRPFRNTDSIRGRSEVRDITSVNEQPLLGETFGFQAEVEIRSPEEVLVNDPDHPITVDLWFYPKAEPWGFKNWQYAPGARRVELSNAEGEPLIFRSMMSNPDSFCEPQVLTGDESYKIVQYQLVAHYYDSSLEQYDWEMSPKDWTMPSWNTGFDDPNAKAGADFSGFTLLESMAPHRAWINEVNYSGPSYDDTKGDQWVELAVPAGVSLKDWKLKLYNRQDGYVGDLLTFGEKCPDSKQSSGDPSHYDFYLVKSPATESIRDASGADVPADATWPKMTANGVSDGILARDYPFGFELVRPTGVVEHRVVIQGWNQYRELGYWYDYLFDGTNLVKELNEKVGGDWTWGGEDYYTNTSWTVGVVTNQGADHAEWSSPMTRTPGAINVGQYIDPEWFVFPNGGYFWIYSTVLGEHLMQTVEGKTNAVATVTVQEGKSTNIVYDVDRWFQLAPPEIKSADKNMGRLEGPVAMPDGKSRYTLWLENVSNRVDITAQAEISDELTKNGLGPNNSYTKAIMNWLIKGVHGGADGKDVAFKGNAITNVLYRGVTGDKRDPLDLTAMYWLDLDPTDGDWELWGGMGDNGGVMTTNRVKTLASGEKQIHTNRLCDVWLMLTNTASRAAYAPYRMQGLGGERSDEYRGVWTSANFKVTMQLLGPDEKDTEGSARRNMRSFVFGTNSFCKGAVDDPAPKYHALIEIVDPHSRESPASEWGWWRYPQLTPVAGWLIDPAVSPAGVSTLQKGDFLNW